MQWSLNELSLIWGLPTPSSWLVALWLSGFLAFVHVNTLPSCFIEVWPSVWTYCPASSPAAGLITGWDVVRKLVSPKQLITLVLLG